MLIDIEKLKVLIEKLKTGINNDYRNSELYCIVNSEIKT